MCKQDGLCTYYYIFSKVYSSYCVYVNIVVYIRCFASKINSLYFIGFLQKPHIISMP